MAKQFSPRPPEIPKSARQESLTSKLAAMRSKMTITAAIATSAGVVPTSPPRHSKLIRPVGRALESYHWRRIILDEFHELCAGSRGIKTNRGIHGALRALTAERRWGLSGTPDVFTDSFAGVTLAARFFRSEMTARSAPDFVEHFCRQARVQLPMEVHEHLCKVDLTPAERVLYIQNLRDLCIPESLSWKDVQQHSDDLRMMLRTCSHFSPHCDSLLSPEEYCSKLFGTKQEERMLREQAYLESLEKLWGVWFRPPMLRQLSDALEAKRHEILQCISQVKNRTPPGRPTSLSDQEQIDSLKRVSTVTQELIRILDGEFPSSFLELVSTSSYGTILEIPGYSDLRKKWLPDNLTSYVTGLNGGRERMLKARKAYDDAVHSLTFFKKTWNSLVNPQAMDRLSCPICLEYLGLESVILYCGHPICKGCMEQMSAGDKSQSKCPTCRYPVSKPESQAVEISSVLNQRSVNELVAAPVTEIEQPKPKPKRQPARKLSKPASSLESWGSKLRSVVQTLESIRANDSSAKVVVFAQWHDLRKKLAKALDEVGISFSMLEGSIFHRTRALKEFQVNSEVSLLLLCLEDSASGTNLTVGSHVFLIHPMLASSLEEAKAYEMQAIGRVRRLGQTRAVHIWRFYASNTVEESLWGLTCQDQC
eukprot:TRINITY_DN9602_c0_g1_i2.p1 TRINITY_DN9602_c0_g1~~TRINITY_DN9602_c0_g1_i2.p1  ORF type:complete len:679 (+),score=99.78 TRINITY_DN9602_c0_g1_i2:85-2037(+)